VRRVLALKPVLGPLAWVRRVRVLRLLLAWERLD
jgi:hypothetical protein